MRFRFCGDLDCPDWVLAEINILARLTSVKMKLLVAQVIKSMLGDAIDYAKVEKLTSDAKYEPGDVKASIAGIRFILSSATEHEVDGDTLSSELQQLGLPKEHAGALCKTYDGKISQLSQQFRKQSFRRSGRLENVTWKIDESTAGGQNVLLEFEMRNKDGNLEKKTLKASPEKFRILLHELKKAQGIMKEMS